MLIVERVEEKMKLRPFNFIIISKKFNRLSSGQTLKECPCLQLQVEFVRVKVEQVVQSSVKDVESESESE